MKHRTSTDWLMSLVGDFFLFRGILFSCGQNTSRRDIITIITLVESKRRALIGICENIWIWRGHFSWHYEIGIGAAWHWWYRKPFSWSITKVTLVVLETNVRNSLSDVILPLAFNYGTWHNVPGTSDWSSFQKWHNVPGTSIDGSLAKLSILGHALVQN